MKAGEAVMKSELDQICNLVRECGLFIKNIQRENIHIDAKSGHANFVTEYDKSVQEKLRLGLAKIIPDAGFVGEEDESARYAAKGKFFIVDPIDGTTNFIKDYHQSCISVALVIDGEAELASVYNPYTDEMFSAAKGCGAWCNGRRLAVSSQPLSNGIVLFGTSPYNEELGRRSFELAYSYFKRALDVRRSGSAALDLCAIAAGRAELFFELRLAPWDHAAGGLLVSEAGGTITDADGHPVRYDCPCSVYARGSGITEETIK